MGKEEELRLIADMMTTWQFRIHNRKALYFYDINRTAEDISMMLLNEIYQLKLANLNRDHPNVSAIDLGDKENKIAFQISSQKDVHKKIIKNLETFVKEHIKTYSAGIRFLFLNVEIPPLKESQKKMYAGICPVFDADKHVLTVKDLLREINRIYDTAPGRFERIKGILMREFGGVMAQKEEKPLLQELYQGSKARVKNLTGPNGRFRYLDIQDILLSPSQLAKKDKKEKWLEPGVVVKGALKREKDPDVEEKKKLTGVDETGVIRNNILEALPGLWGEECCHTVLKGEGGMGKTVSLIRLWKEYTKPDNYVAGTPVPVFIQLNEINHWEKTSNGNRFITDQMNRYYLNTSVTEISLLNLMKNPMVYGDGGAPAVILLLDGFNEITVEENRCELLLELLDIMEQCAGVQVVVTSRYDMRAAMNWGHFHLLELLGPKEESISKYLKSRRLEIPGKKQKEKTEAKTRLKSLLTNPMMLTIYASTSEVVKKHQEQNIGQYDFKEEVETNGELLWNFMECQAACMMDRTDKKEAEKWFYRFLLHFMLPALGFRMEKQGDFEIRGDQLNEMLKHYCQHYSRQDFLSSYSQYQECIKYFYLEDDDKIAPIKRINDIKRILTHELCMLVEEGASYRFLHQDFRDFFAAVHLLNEIDMSLRCGEVSEVLKERALSVYVCRFMGEIDGEHQYRPMLLEGKWTAVENKEGRLYRVLEMVRGCFDGSVGYCVGNLLQTWQEVRGDLSGMDLRNLDFSILNLNGVIFSRFHREGYLAACFDGALVHEGNFLPRAHSCLRTSTGYSADGKRILSASFDGTITEWDVPSGQCLKIFHGHTRDVMGAIYSADGKRILSASYDRTIREWDVSSGQCLKILHTSRLYDAGYSPDGKRIISVNWGGFIKEWEVSSGQCVKTTQLNAVEFFKLNLCGCGDNRFERKEDEIIVKNTKTKENFLTLPDIPGLFVQGCSLRELHAKSQWSDTGLKAMRMYGANIIVAGTKNIFSAMVHMLKKIIKIGT